MLCLFMQGINGCRIVHQLVCDVFVFLQQSLNIGLVLSDIVGRNNPEEVQHPGVDIIGISQELVEVNCLCETAFPEN